MIGSGLPQPGPPCRRRASHALSKLVRTRILRTDASPAVTLAKLLLDTGDPEGVAQTLDGWLRQTPGPQAWGRVSEVARLLAANRSACDQIVRMLGLGSWTDEHAVSEDDRVAACRRLFDDLVQYSEEASVALYSLGNATLLDAATHEVVDRMRHWGLVESHSTFLQIGCGIGRFELALSASVAEVHGIDVAPRMIDVARRRCRHLPNVYLTVGSGRDLAPYEDGYFDLVYAIDSMPYLVEAGQGVVLAYVREAARVLKPAGRLLIDNYSYRESPAQDCGDVLELADSFGFDVISCGATPFSLWDGQEYLLERRGAHSVRVTAPLP